MTLGRRERAATIRGSRLFPETVLTCAASPPGRCPVTPIAGGLSESVKLTVTWVSTVDRLAVQQKRLVLPLLDGLDGGRGEHGMSADQLHILHVARFADLHFQQNEP